MYWYNNRSEQRLLTCDPRLIDVFSEVVTIIDNSVICGHRNAVDQNSAFESNNSKVQWPNSKHNETPSKGIDVAPYPTMWDDERMFFKLAGVVMAVAKRRNIKIRWGGDWDSDGDSSDQTFMDLAHFEVVD